MQALERPRLRPDLVADRDRNDPNCFVIRDTRKIVKTFCQVTERELALLQMFDGERTLREIQEEAMKQAEGWLVPLDQLAFLAQRMDRALFLDGPRFRELLASPVREPTCLGCYEAEPDALREQIAGLFAGRGPGVPRSRKPDGKLCAALIPHIDYHRGGSTYAWGFKEVFERTDASLFVIIGTSHYSLHRFTLTRKSFKTPLGIAPTDQSYIDRLVAHYGPGLFDDEIAHLPEHSIELEVVFLQYYYEGRRPIRIVPLVVGSFRDCVDAGRLPRDCADIGRMIEALRRAEAESGEPICYIISGDLAHIGPEFGDPGPLADDFLALSRRQDEKICRAAAAVDTATCFEVIAEESDRRRICGLPPAYTLLEAVRPERGQLLHYDQHIHPRRAQSVSFASVAFYR
jgi:AmmeMemoRadiSam system protein B